MTLPNLAIILASPRGFCAGVDRAIQMVENALKKFGAPVYVRHEIVHNKTVVDTLRQQGAIFIRELDDITDRSRPVIFSAHGVPKTVPAQAASMNLLYFDATCPLVTKVHREAEQHYRAGRTLIMLGHAGHPEVIGTMGQLPAGAVRLVENAADIASLTLPAETPLAYITQTTLSVDDTAALVEQLRQKYPNIIAPKKEDICYATSNRQAAVKAIAPSVECFWVLGAPNSSNSNRLVEVAQTYGCPNSHLVQRPEDIMWAQLDGVKRLGLTAGASAPESLVQGVINACAQRFTVTVETMTTVTEDITFHLPAALRV